jgi:ABC-type bacteriocin/lantibiotic exporter with double-glycine peptidase domain
MSQVYDATFNPQAPSSTANCGPTSLAMALVAFGKAPASTDPENLIEQVRIRMTGQDDLNQLTSESQVASAARSYGLKTNLVNSAAEVCDAVNAGNLVILAGNPAAYNKGLSPSQYMAFDGGHFVLVTGTVGDDVLINDPLSHVGTLRISRDQLARFMAYQGWNSGVAVQG